MTLRQHLRRRIAWFLPTETPHEQHIPPRFGPRTFGLAFFLPISVYLTHHFNEPMFVIGCITLLLVVLVDDYFAHEIFHLGMDSGRRELVAEIMEAWRENNIHPNEFLSREVWIGAEEIEAARNEVHRSVRGQPPSG